MAERRVVQDLNTPKHYNPIPTYVTLGNLILPSVMGAYDPKLPPEQQGPEVQIEKSVANMKNIIVSARLCKNSVHSARGEANCLN
jgi:hypothetical protein